MSHKAVRWALENSKSRAGTRCVLLAIADRIGVDDTAWPGLETIAREANVSRRTVIRAVEWLEDHGELTVKRHGGGLPGLRERHRPNLYKMPMRTGSANDADNVSSALPHSGGATTTDEVSSALPHTGPDEVSKSTRARRGRGVTGDTVTVREPRAPSAPPPLEAPAAASAPPPPVPPNQWWTVINTGVDIESDAHGQLICSCNDQKPCWHIDRVLQGLAEDEHRELHRSRWDDFSDELRAALGEYWQTTPSDTESRYKSLHPDDIEPDLKVVEAELVKAQESACGGIGDPVLADTAERRAIVDRWAVKEAHHSVTADIGPDELI